MAVGVLALTPVITAVSAAAAISMVAVGGTIALLSTVFAISQVVKKPTLQPAAAKAAAQAVAQAVAKETAEPVAEPEKKILTEAELLAEVSSGAYNKASNVFKRVWNGIPDPFGFDPFGFEQLLKEPFAL